MHFNLPFLGVGRQPQTDGRFSSHAVLVLRLLPPCRSRWLTTQDRSLAVPSLITDVTGLGGWSGERVAGFFQRLFMRGGLLTLTTRTLACLLMALLRGLGEHHQQKLGRLTAKGGGGPLLPLRPQGRVEVPLLAPDLQLQGLHVLYGATATPFVFLLSLSLAIWQAGVSASPAVACGGALELMPGHVLSWVGLSLRLTYRIRYHALDRKIRKIVKNKYRYVRSYVCIREAHRVRHGLRLVPLGVLLCPERRWGARLSVLLETLVWAPQTSVVRQLRQQHHNTALGALGLV
jgi:hypothetical protein